MTTFNYDVHVDTLKNGVFGGSIDNLNDLVRAISWQQGMDEPRGYLARPSRAQIVLNNINNGSPCAPFDYDYAGAEELTNGDFSAWTAGVPDGWALGTFSAPSAVTEVSPSALYGGGGNGAINLYRPNANNGRVTQTALAIGKTYRARMTITAIDTSKTGGVSFRNGVATPIDGPLYQSVGVKEWVFVAQYTTLSLFAVGKCNVTIDSVTVAEVCKYAAVAEGMLVRISSTDAYGVGTPLARTQFWVGRIAKPIRSYAPQTGMIDGQSVTLECEDPMAELFDGEYVPKLMQNTTVDAVIGAVLDSGLMLYPYSRSGWLLGVEGAGSLGLTTRLAPTEGYRALDTGETAIEWCGDASERGEGISVASYLQDVVASEAGGRLFWDGRTSMVTFHSRNHDVLTTPLVTVDSTRYSAAELKYGDPVYNAITIYYTERQIGDAQSVVWSADNLPMRIAGNVTREFSARYRLSGDSTATIAVIDEIQPIAGVDFTATVNEDGSGGSMNNALIVIVEWKANVAKVRVVNSGATDVYMQTLQLRATPLIARPGQLTKSDGDSIFMHGLRPAEPINLVNIANADFAASMASYLLGIYKTPRQMVRQVTFEANRDSDTANWLFSCGIGTRITVQDSTINHDGEYVIVGEQHSVEALSKVHYVTWTLKPLSREATWILNVSALGDTTRLAL